METSVWCRSRQSPVNLITWTRSKWTSSTSSNVMINVGCGQKIRPMKGLAYKKNCGVVAVGRWNTKKIWYQTSWQRWDVQRKEIARRTPFCAFAIRQSNGNSTLINLFDTKIFGQLVDEGFVTVSRFKTFKTILEFNSVSAESTRAKGQRPLRRISSERGLSRFVGQPVYKKSFGFKVYSDAQCPLWIPDS